MPGKSEDLPARNVQEPGLGGSAGFLQPGVWGGAGVIPEAGSFPDVGTGSGSRRTAQIFCARLRGVFEVRRVMKVRPVLKPSWWGDWPPVWWVGDRLRSRAMVGDGGGAIYHVGGRGERSRLRRALYA